MKSVINGLAVGLGRKIAFEMINDVKKEHDVKFSPRSLQVFKEMTSFKLGASYNATSAKLLQMLDSIQTEHIKNPEKAGELRKYIDFVGSKLPLLEMQITNHSHQRQYDNLTTFFDQISRTVR